MITQAVILAILSALAGFLIGALITFQIMLNKIQLMKSEIYDLRTKLFDVDEERDDDLYGYLPEDDPTNV